MSLPPTPDDPKPRSPGDFIRDELKARGWTQDDLARILNRPLPTVNEIIQGKRAVMPEMAIALGMAFGTPPAVWMQREGMYRLSLAGGDAGEEVRRRAKLYESAPIKEMQKRGWIKQTETTADLERELCRFFGVENMDAEPAITAAMKKTAPHLPLTPTQKAWCCRVRQIARALKVAAFDPARLDACARELRKLAAYSAETRKVPTVLASYGIRFVVVEPLPGTKVDGMATWLDEQSPVIGVSVRFDRVDNFWHVVGHEFSHIKHRDAFSLDSDVGEYESLPLDGKPAFECRADEEAAALFIPLDELKSFILRVGPLYSRDRINQFANRIKIHPGVIVGQLQHRGEVGYSALKDTLVKIRHVVTPVALTDGWGHTIDPRVFA